MKLRYVYISMLCFLLLALTIVIAIHIQENVQDGIQPPEVDTNGLCHPLKATVSESTTEPIQTLIDPLTLMPTPEPTPEPTPVCYTDDDIYILAQAMDGECYEFEYQDMINVGMTICNRVDDPRFPDTIAGVIKQPNQIHGYSPYNTPSEVCLKAAAEVLDNWNAIKNGESRPWNYAYLYWCASGGTTNSFRSEY